MMKFAGEAETPDKRYGVKEAAQNTATKPMPYGRRPIPGR
jgi:hypothetical protein